MNGPTRTEIRVGLFGVWGQGYLLRYQAGALLEGGFVHITGAFLAEEAEIVDQKLSVTGGVLDSVPVPVTGLTNENGEQLVARLFLVTLMQAGPDDQDTPYRMKLEFVASDGDVVTIYDGEIPLGAHQGENRFWVMPIGLTAARSGRMTLIQTIEGGGSISVPIQVRVVDRL